jgi:hypothetical protein
VRTAEITKNKKITTEAGMLLKANGAKEIRSHRPGYASQNKQVERYSRYVVENARSCQSQRKCHLRELRPKDVKTKVNPAMCMKKHCREATSDKAKGEFRGRDGGKVDIPIPA